jgi:FkbM family methyltransferase
MSLRKCNTAYGECTFYGKDTYIGKSLYYYGEWSGDECDMLRALCRGTFIDIGANIGVMSMAVAALGYSVHSFEPQPSLYNLLKQNAPRATSYNIALSNHNGTAKMPRIDYSSKGNFGGVGFGRSDLGSIEVEVRTLDSFNLAPSLIKIDVEGHELAVLQGAVETIAKYSPTLYVEDDRPELRYELRKFIRSLGYKIEEHNPPMFRDNNYACYDKNVWDKKYISMNLICSK